jgi:hypothetical protein
MPKIQNKQTALLIVAVFLLLFGAYFVFSNKETARQDISPVVTENQSLQENSVEQPAIETKIESKQATLEINGVSHQSDIGERTSVYDFMDKLRNEGKINFKDKTYIGMGKFIEEINEVRGDGTRYWIYYVNGKKALIGVSNYKINPGDVVSWRYESEQ